MKCDLEDVLEFLQSVIKASRSVPRKVYFQIPKLNC